MQIISADAKRALNAHLWTRHPDDWYVEEHWVDHRLFEHERFEGSVCDPACGLGRIVQAAQLARFGRTAWGQDKAERSPYCVRVADVLCDEFRGRRPDNIVSIPTPSNGPGSSSSKLAKSPLEKSLCSCRSAGSAAIPARAGWRTPALDGC